MRRGDCRPNGRTIQGALPSHLQGNSESTPTAPKTSSYATTTEASTSAPTEAEALTAAAAAAAGLGLLS